MEERHSCCLVQDDLSETNKCIMTFFIYDLFTYDLLERTQIEMEGTFV